MSKYIDAKKLIKSVNNYLEGAKAAFNPIDGDADYYKGKIDTCESIQEIIAYLQQDQPKFKVGDTIHETGENTVFPMTIERISDGDYVCDGGKCFVSIKFQDDYELVEQEQPEIALIHKPNMTISEMVDSINGKQPEVDLEKFTEKVNTFKARYKHPEIVSIKGAMAFMARLFYQYPNVARQWYEQLPKATMD